MSIHTIDKTKELYQKQIDKNINQIIESKKFDGQYTNFLRKVSNQLIIDAKDHIFPHVSGWYYINMVGGTWIDQILKKQLEDYHEFSPGAEKVLTELPKSMGNLIKDIDPPQLNVEYETISGRLRNINTATRILPTSEFSMTWQENPHLDVLKYHEIWRDYMDAHRKGFAPKTENYKDEDIFIDVPYFNAVWIVIFKPFTFELAGLVKLMGVAPTNLPLKDVIGQRGTAQATTFSISYKTTDTITMLYGRETPSGPFYENFINDAQMFFK